MDTNPRWNLKGLGSILFRRKLRLPQLSRKDISFSGQTGKEASFCHDMTARVVPSHASIEDELSGRGDANRPATPPTFHAQESRRRGSCISSQRSNSTTRGGIPGISQRVVRYQRGYKWGHYRTDRKSTRLNSSHSGESRMPSSA